jgi:hypothetical protein
MSLPDTSALGPAASILASVNSGWPVQLEIWGGILGALCTVPPFLAYYVGYGRKAPVLLIPVAFVVVGAVLVALAFMMDPASQAYTYAPVLAEKSAAEANQMAARSQIAVDAIEVAWDLGSFLAYGLGSLWAAILLLRVEGVPKWINVLGIAGGLALIVWMIALSAALARTPGP